MKKTLYVNRGLPGSGKSTRARNMAEKMDEHGYYAEICSSDDFFVCPCCHAYNFAVDRLGFAHKWCQSQAAAAMARGVDFVIVDNTNVTARECRPYVESALCHGYEVVFLEPETSWAFDIDELVKKNTHNVPREALERMLARWVPDMTVEKALGTPSDGVMTEDEKAAAGKAA